MTDQQTYTTTWGDALLSLMRSIPTYGDGNLAVKLPPIMSESVVIPTGELLAMIDRLDPDAMRAYLRETVPEADSPEDVDERVPPREALLTDAQERRLYLIEQLTKTVLADEAPALAHWIITGGMDQLEDLTLSGESLNR